MLNWAGRRYFAPDSEVMENEVEQLDSFGSASEFIVEVPVSNTSRNTLYSACPLFPLCKGCDITTNLVHITQVTMC
jgi:hypothetical protein